MKKSFFLLLFLFVLRVMLNAQLSPSALIENKYLKSTFIKLQFENDVFLKSDYYYTNGVNLTISNSSFKSRILDRLLHAPVKLEKNLYSIRIQQNMYTPQNLSSTEIQDNDHPYAGYLVADYLHHTYDDNTYFISSFTLGVLGDYSAVGQAQNLTHLLIKNDSTKGWSNQLSNTPLINIGYQINQLIVDNNFFKFFINAQGRVGSLYTDASAGFETRLGLINSTFEFFTQRDSKKPFEVFIFLRPELRVSYFDATLQGTLFRKSPGNYFISNEQKNAFVLHYQTGIELSIKDLNIIASITKHTKEFKGADKWHGWGSITLSYRF